MGGEEEEEEEEEACMGFGSWEEQMYWTHFQYTHFSRLLLPGFHKSLAIPEQFSSTGKKLPEIVGLQGPSGITWKVGLVARGSSMVFAKGWEEFAKDHCLRENDLLVFKYDGYSTFQVSIFDGGSSCERPATYFVRKRGIGGDHSNGVPSKRNASNTCPVPYHDAGGTSSKKFAGDGIDKPPEAASPRIVVVALEATNKLTKSKEKNKVFDVVDLTCITGSGNASPDNKETDAEPDVGHPSADSVHLAGHNWSGKIVTQVDRHRALTRAEAAISSKGFTIVMNPSRLTEKGRYHARIPVQFTKNLVSSTKQNVILRMDNNSWRVKLICKVIENSKSFKGASFAGFCGGWKNFVNDNNIHEYDVCAFEPVVTEKSSIVLSVQIFRVDAHES